MASLNDDYNIADNAAVGNQLGYTDISGNIQNVSNAAQQPGSVAGTFGLSRADTIVSGGAPADLASPDHYAQVAVTISATPSTSSCQAGVAVRANSSNGDCYLGFLVKSSAGVQTYSIQKYVSGARTNLVSGISAISWTSGDILRLQADGPTLTLYRNGARVAAVYDQSIKTGTRVGIMMLAGTSATRSTTFVDSLNAADISPSLIKPVQIAAAVGATVSSVTVDSAAGWATPTAENLLVAVISASTTLAGITVPAGFVVDDSRTSGTNLITTVIAHKVSNGTETSLQMSTSTAVNQQMFVYELSGNADSVYVPGPVSDVGDGGGNVATLSLPATAAIANSGIAIAGVGLSGSGTFTAWATDLFTTIVAPTTSRAFTGYDYQLVPGSTPQTTVTWGTARRAAGVLVVYYDATSNPPGSWGPIQI